MLVKRILTKFLRLRNAIGRLCRISKTIDVDALEKEVGNEIYINKSQITNWLLRFNVERDSIFHPYVQVAQAYTNSGLHERASEFYLRYLYLQEDKRIRGLYLQNLLLSASATNQTLLTAHQYWAKKHAVQPMQFSHDVFPNHNGQTRKLKIGYVCHFFTNSISQNVLLPLLERHDRSKFEVYCYDDGETDPQHHRYANHWRDIRGWSDKQLANQIKSDGIDILQEANGFCVINRFGALSYKPAPIQINWYNHVSTTGLPYIDYVMSDSHSIIDSDLPYFVEKAYRHDHFIAAVGFEENKFGTLVSATPCVKNNYVTFCYFGGSHKITLAAIELWSKVIKKVSGSKMLLKCSAFTEERYRKIFNNHFKKFGVGDEQIIFEGWSDQAATLKKYNEIDIMLDNVPVNGGSTFFEALMQGVPVVTMLGNRWAARSGPSVLTTLNHPELIAKSEDEYVEIAARLANNIPDLNHYRQNLREEMLKSSLTDMDQFYQNFEKAYFHMWDQRCQQLSDA